MIDVTALKAGASLWLLGADRSACQGGPCLHEGCTAGASDRRCVFGEHRDGVLKLAVEP